MRKMKQMPQRLKRGSVLLTVLIVAAFALGVGVAIFERSGIAYREVIDRQGDTQGAIYAGSALRVAQSLMTMNNATYDASDSLWTIIPPIPVNNGYVNISIQAADGRLPINPLAETDDNKSVRIKNAFEKLFNDLDIDLEWETLRDWVITSDATAMSSVFHDEFNREGTGFTAKHAPLASLYEIRLIPGAPKLYQTLAEHLCAGDRETKININFATERVIAALIPELERYAPDIVAARDENPFTSKDDLYKLIGDQEAYTAALPYFDVKSNFFYIKIEVNILESVWFYHALLKRNGNRYIIMNYIEGKDVIYF
jgi:type II secretory pathway component PulK